MPFSVNPEWFKNFFREDFYNFDFIPPEKTRKEVDFVLKVSGIKKDARILDVPCGTGRHAILLSKKGYDVIGVDYSKDYIKKAKSIAAKNGLRNIKFFRKDMRKMDYRNEFDLVLNLFSSFGYFKNMSDNILFLKKVHRALKNGGYFILDTVNGANLISVFTYKDWYELPDGSFYLEERELSRDKKRIYNRWIKIKGKKIIEKKFMLWIFDRKRITDIVKEVGFKVIDIYGSFEGEKYSLDSKRIILICQKR